MSEKVSLLAKAVDKVSLDKKFIAFLMREYLEYEKISQQEILLQLRCSEEEYYKLCLCNAPDMEAGDFVSRVNSIGEYAHVSAIEISRIIKRANMILNFTEDEERT